MEKQWYIIHTYSGFEKKVKESLESRVAAFGLQDKIGRMMIPTEDVLEVRGDKKVISTRMLYPGYVLVEMDMDDYTWHVVRNTPRVTGFVGSGETPTPLSEIEVENILHRVTTSADRPKPKLVFERNEQVRIIEGPFANFTGVVDDVNADRNTLKVAGNHFWADQRRWNWISCKWRRWRNSTGQTLQRLKPIFCRQAVTSRGRSPALQSETRSTNRLRLTQAVNKGGRQSETNGTGEFVHG